jgi:subtilase family serine protease
MARNLRFSWNGSKNYDKVINFRRYISSTGFRSYYEENRYYGREIAATRG